MSGSPKYSRAELDRQRQAKIAEQRKRRAEAEAKRRREAEERERQRQLTQARRQQNQLVQQLLKEMEQQSQLCYPQDYRRLKEQGESIKSSIDRLGSLSELADVGHQVGQLRQDWERAKRQKWQDEEEAKRKGEIERQQLALESELQRLESLADVAQKFDPVGWQTVQTAMKEVLPLLERGNPQAIASPLAAVQQQNSNYLAQVQTLQQAWETQKATAESQLAQLQSLIAGLQADPVVMCWQGSELVKLIGYQEQSQQALTAEQFPVVADYLRQAETLQGEMIANANGAQLQADQRDYIADSIASSLEELGFNVVYRQAEHPDHPASAVIMGAVTPAGKGISVSVPVDGEVFYDVDGYSKQTVAVVGGGQAAVCDEAEQVIDEMHDFLAAQFGIQMGELNWEGKNPQRQLRQADSLPQSSSSEARRS
jgi:hypothetical protein